MKELEDALEQEREAHSRVSSIHPSTSTLLVRWYIYINYTLLLLLLLLLWMQVVAEHNAHVKSLSPRPTEIVEYIIIIILFVQ